MATEEAKIDMIVPPVAVALIDVFLHELSSGDLVSSTRAQDMLLDVRRVLWAPTELSLVVCSVMDQNARNKRPTSSGRAGQPGPGG